MALDQLAEPPRVIPHGRRAQRLPDVLLLLFHQACDEGDLDVAERLLWILETIAMRSRLPRVGSNWRLIEALVGAHERLWAHQHPDAGER